MLVLDREDAAVRTKLHRVRLPLESQPLRPDGQRALYPDVSDNGRLICVECAGMSAKFTRRDISGQRVTAVPYLETVAWFKQFHKPMACEAGCTTYLLPKK